MAGRQLTPQENAIESVRQEFALLYSVLDQYIARTERSERSRCMNIARTQIELGELMAIKALGMEAL